MIKKFWNTFFYLSPVIISLLVYLLTSLKSKIDYSDTEFTISWAVATVAAGFILSNLPTDSNWLIKVKTNSGLFKRMSLFLMSPTLYGLIHYASNRVLQPVSDVISMISFTSYVATFVSVVFTFLLLLLIVVKVQD